MVNAACQRQTHLHVLGDLNQLNGGLLSHDGHDGALDLGGGLHGVGRGLECLQMKARDGEQPCHSCEQCMMTTSMWTLDHKQSMSFV